MVDWEGWAWEELGLERKEGENRRRNIILWIGLA